MGEYRVYAIIQTGGKQYRVQQGDVIYVEKLNVETDATIDFDVLLLGGEKELTVGKPLVAGAKVQAKVLGQGRGEKIVVFKYKSKKNYRRKQGHRQPYTKVEITAIQA
jgi:large subunit ribosomal protein L21